MGVGALAAKEFLFSIVMSVYNVEPYIEEAVDSILNQTIGFEENVQLIFVNDGSTDNSGNICMSYQSKYPANIVYIEQENAGQAAARNAGLKYVAGRFVNFCDSDDTFSANALTEVGDFFRRHKLEIDTVAIPMVYFEHRKGLHAKYKDLGGRNRIINLLRDPANFILSASATFYKVELFNETKFDEDLIVGEDSDFNYRLMVKKPRFGYVCEKGVQYNYRKRTAEDSIIDACSSCINESYALSILGMLRKNFVDQDKLLRPFQKEFISYQMRNLLHDVRRKGFPSGEAYDDFVDKCKDVASLLDVDFILHQSKCIDSAAKKQLFLCLKGMSLSRCLSEGCVDTGLFDLSCKDVHIQPDFFDLDVVFNNYGCAIDVVVWGPDGKIYQAVSSSDLEAPFNAAIGEFKLDETHFRHFTLPYEVGTYTFYFNNASGDKLEAARKLRATGKPPLMSLGPALGVSRFGRKLFIKGGSIEVVQDSGNELVRGIATAKLIKRNSRIIARLRPFSRDKKKYVIVMDRPNKAGDNGQALYEHIMKYGSEKLRHRTYFVLDKNAGDYSYLPKKSHVLQPKSLKHKLIFLNAQIVYSSHNARQFYMPFAHNGKYYADLLDYEFVWLQHGIAQNDYTRQANRLRTEDDYIVTSTPKEKEMLLSPAYFYAPSQILLTGLSRYDKLSSDSKRIITIAPTWRSSLCGKILANGFHEPVPGFENSEYYRMFAKLLTSERFKAMLEKYDFKCQFLCHMGFACYENWFEKLASNRVEILHQADANYSQIFKESSIFVTDFSSTAFDFAYLNKPLIYFQFDELTQYDPGWFSYEENGLGPITKTVDETLDKIEHYLENGCAVDGFYADRIDSFFAYRDKNNCKRLLDATLPEDLK